jgi:hypothetical protein
MNRAAEGSFGLRNDQEHDRAVTSVASRLNCSYRDPLYSSPRQRPPRLGTCETARTHLSGAGGFVISHTRSSHPTIIRRVEAATSSQRTLSALVGWASRVAGRLRHQLIPLLIVVPKAVRRLALGRRHPSEL